MKERRILRKNRENTVEHEIVKLFTTDKQAEVAAWFAGQTHNVTKVRTKKNPSHSVNDIFGAIELDECPQRHFSQARVSELVYPAPYGRKYGDQLHDGALQVFVEPREPQDSILRLIWTPAGCVCEKRTNKHELVPTLPAADATPSSFHTAASAAAPPPAIDHRIASFGTSDLKQPLLGPTASPVGSMVHHTHEFVTINAIKMRLEEFGENIANHLYELSREKTSVSRMELFFKIDRDNKIWFLFCDSLLLNSLELTPSPSFGLSQSNALKSPRPMMINSPRSQPGSITLPSHQDKELSRPLSAHPKSKASLIEDLSGDVQCPLTGETYPKCQRIQVTYKLILLHWLRLCSDPPQESREKYDPDSIPPALLRAHPSLTLEYFTQRRSNQIFLLGTLFVSPAGARELSRASLDDLSESFNQAFKRRQGTSSPPTSPKSFRRRTAQDNEVHSPSSDPLRTSLPTIRSQVSPAHAATRPNQRPSSSSAAFRRPVSTDSQPRKGPYSISLKESGWMASAIAEEERSVATPDKRDRSSTVQCSSDHHPATSSPMADSLPAALRPKSRVDSNLPDRGSSRSSQIRSNPATPSSTQQRITAHGASGASGGVKARCESPIPFPPSHTSSGASPPRPLTSEESRERTSRRNSKAEVRDETHADAHQVPSLFSSTSIAIKLYSPLDSKEKMAAAPHADSQTQAKPKSGAAASSSSSPKPSPVNPRPSPSDTGLSLGQKSSPAAAKAHPPSPSPSRQRSTTSPARQPPAASSSRSPASKDHQSHKPPPPPSSKPAPSTLRQSSTHLAPIAESKVEALPPYERKSLTRLNEDEVRKLKELSESTKKAEVVTAALLAEAEGLLAEGTVSRPSASAVAAREKAKAINTAGPPEAKLTADEVEELSEALMD